MNRIAFSFLASLAVGFAASATADPLPSWNEGPAKQSIVSFVERTTTAASPEYVVPDERTATFDNDGCLWAEQPLYFQLIYMIDRIRALAPDHPEWKDEEPFASILKGDVEKSLAGGEKSLVEMAMATHAGITTEEFSQSVRDWLATARHPKTGRPYNEMVYQPMLEVLAYLRANGFKPFIVTGGGIDFVRVFAEETYGIPPEQVIGSSIRTGYEIRDGKPTLVKLPELNFINDKDGKPVGIHQHIGRRPIAAFGNSDGDFQMLEWTTMERTPSLGVYIHHDDTDREWAYDRDSHIGKLDRGLDEAPERGWVVVSMKDDWATIFPKQKAPAMSKLSLEDSAWRIEAIEGSAVIADSEATIRFDADGRVSGRSGCNAFSGSASIEAGGIVLGPLAATRMACPPPLMDQEQRLFQALDQVRAYSMDEDSRLDLKSAAGVTLIELKGVKRRI